MEKMTIAICGATGQQGGAFLEAALKRNLWNLVALSRNPDSDKSRNIREKGIKVIKADLADKNSLISAFQGIHSVFGVTQPWSGKFTNLDIKGEVQQGRNIVDACIEANVSHLIMSTMSDIGFQNTKIPHFATKTIIDNYVKGSNLPYTLLKPAIFMDLIPDAFITIKNNRIEGQTNANLKLPFVAIKDIGEFAAIIFEQPDQYHSKELNLVGDFISGNEMASRLSRIRNGEIFKYKAQSKLYMWFFENYAYNIRKELEIIYKNHTCQQEILHSIRECKAIYPEIMTIEKFFKFKNFEHFNFY